MGHNKKLQKLQQHSISQVAHWLFALVIMVAPSSLLRWETTGFLLVYGIHLSIIISTMLLFVFRSVISSWVIEVFIISCCYIAGISSTITFGLSTTTVIMLIVALFVASVSLKKKMIFSIGGSYLLVVGCVGYFYYTGDLTPAADLNLMMSKPINWIAPLLVISISCFSLINSMVNQFNFRTDLLKEIADQNKKIEYLANHDDLTKLPTQRLANDRLNMAINLARRNKSKTALLFIDLDGFKTINDTHGHDAGNYVLTVVAEKMLEMTRDTDTCCRIGGDEFLVIIPDITDNSVIESICQRLIQEIGKPIIYNDDQELRVGVSIGGARYPNDADDADSLRQKADEMMYQVKKTGKNNFLLCT